MQFVGDAEKLTADEIEQIAQDFCIEPAALRAVIRVESSGSGFDAMGRPKILFERHFFYRHLIDTPNLLAQAEQLGIAYRRWGERPYPKTSSGVYQELETAINIDEEAALLSTSWGMGQIMGENFRLVDCKSVYEMVDEVKVSERNQIVQMCHYIHNTGLIDELQNHDWAGFARHYNGPQYTKNNYDTKLADAYKEYA